MKCKSYGENKEKWTVTFQALTGKPLHYQDNTMWDKEGF